MAKTVKTPEGYTLAETNLQATIASHDLLQWLPNLDAYDPKICAKACDDLEDCVSFNLMVLRCPSLAPREGDCPNPPSQTEFLCSFYNDIPPSPLKKKDLIFSDMWYDFELVVAGSNGRSTPHIVPRYTDFSALQSTTRSKPPSAQHQTATSATLTPRSPSPPQPPTTPIPNPSNPSRIPSPTATAPPSSATVGSRWTTHP